MANSSGKTDTSSYPNQFPQGPITDSSGRPTPEFLRYLISIHNRTGGNPGMDGAALSSITADNSSSLQDIIKDINDLGIGISSIEVILSLLQASFHASESVVQRLQSDASTFLLATMVAQNAHSQNIDALTASMMSDTIPVNTPDISVFSSMPIGA